MEMHANKQLPLLPFLLLILVLSVGVCKCTSQCQTQSYTYVVQEATYTRLCSTKSILTVNGQYPGPTIFAYKGDTVKVEVINASTKNITLHWHGVKQPRNPWSDGPEYITQCPIQPGRKFIQTIILSDEEGTIWWHAHSEWARATVHGAFVIYPKPGTCYPFPKPDIEVPIILGEWWRRDVYEVYREFIATGGDPNISDAFTINGQPGDLYPCSAPDTYRLNVHHGETILLRMISAPMNVILFVSISGHSMTVVGTDGSYTKPLIRDVIAIGPGQTMDVILQANQTSGCYYMAAKAYSSALRARFDNTTTTAILQYDYGCGCNSSSPPSLPDLPNYNDTNASYAFTSSLRSLASEDHPVEVPLKATHRIFTTLSVNTIACPVNRSCEGPNATIFKASMNNMSFVLPQIDVLEAYYYHIKGVFSKHFPKNPPLVFDYTADFQDLLLETPTFATRVMVLPYNSTVEMIMQGTNLVGGIDHPMHLHGHNFYVVGFGLGNFNKHKDPKNYNLVDPPQQSTVIVPKNGWATIRFKTQNPGVWYMHCHMDRHQTWGMMTTVIVKDGPTLNSRVLPPPPDMPPC